MNPKPYPFIAWLNKRIDQLFLFFFLILTVFLLAAPPQAAAVDFIIAVDDNARLYYAASNGDGTFTGYAELDDNLGGTYSRGVTINDFDNDGDMDVIAGRGVSTNAYFYLFENDGSNNFTKTAIVGTLSNVASYAMDMASGDFNNDGLMDFIANGNRSTTGVFLGDGTGRFSKTQFDLSGYGRGMDVADFNNDGNLDVARAVYSSGIISVLPGNGDGTFGDPIQAGDPGSNPYGVVAGDFNNDGNADIVADAGSTGDPMFFAGNGDNTFVAGILVTSLDFDNHGAYDGFDFNGDGDLDIVAVNYTGKQVLYYPGNGDGTFGVSVAIGATTGNALGVSAMPIGPPTGIPTADITPTTQTIDKGDTANFNGSASADPGGALASWVWDFDDGTTQAGTGTNVGTTTHAYALEGTFYPNLMVTDNAGNSDNAAAQVIVEGNAPAVNTSPVSFNESYATDGLWDLTLDGTNYATDTEGIVSYEWDLGDGLSENFEDGNADGWVPLAGTWSVVDIGAGVPIYVYHQSDINADRTWTLYDKTFDTDMTIEADVTLVSGSGEEAHIIFRAVNEMNNYEFILRGRGLNDVLLYRRVNGGTTTLSEFDLPAKFPGSPDYIDIGNSYHIKIVCTGALMQFYLDGEFLFAYEDSTFMSGKIGFSTYRTESQFDNLTVTTTATGQMVPHAFTEGAYNVSLTVKDAAGQSATGVVPMTMASGAAPVANSGGVYNVNESAASMGHWTVSLDGSGSSDDVEIEKYIWDFGPETFDGTEYDRFSTLSNGGITQNDAVTITGASPWGERYLVTAAIFPNVKGQIFQTKFMTTGSGQCMIGFKNENTTNFHYNQFPYAIYVNSTNINIYENGSSRGNTGYDITYNVWYDFKIELTEAGAVYSFRPSDTTRWTDVYYSTYTTADTNLRKGVVVYSGAPTFDDFREVTAGETPTHQVYGPPDLHDFMLTVVDGAGQSHTAIGEVATTSAAGPTGDFNNPDNQTLDETDATDNIFTANFDASTAQTPFSDDVGIALYEWDFEDDGTFDYSSSEPTASWGYPGVGTYTVRLRVMDNALRTHEDTLVVTVTQGNPPTADAGANIAVDEADASEGGWTAAFDGSASTDGESSIAQYVWDFGTDTFTGTQINDYKWDYTQTTVTQDNAIIISPASSGWGKDNFFSRDVYTRAKGMAFEAKVKQVTGNAMIGFKNTSGNNHYNQMPYAVYFYSGDIRIYENGTNRGDTGYDYAMDTEYDVRIELKPVSGATYYYRETGAPDWILLYDSDYSSATSFKRGFDVYVGEFIIDDIKETAGGPTPNYRFYETGNYSVALTVWDQAYQTDTDTTTLTVAANESPVADAGSDQTIEGIWPVAFDASGSSDDTAIFRYEWDFGDGFTGTGEKLSHMYTTPGEYTVTLTVYDHALQSDSDTLTVTSFAGNAPVADAGGPYTAGSGGPPAYFDGTASSDDNTIVKFLWDADIATDSDGDQDPANDIDAVGRNPFYTYEATGTYTARLTVIDGAGQSDTDDTAVTVVDNMAPDVICVPWRAGYPNAPHETFNGQSIRLKAIVRDAGDLEYKWDFGDGTFYPEDGSSFEAVTDKYAIEASHTYPVSADGTPYMAVLTVKDSAGLTGTDNYYVIVRPDDPDTRTNVAIDEGLWWLHKNQDKATGSFFDSSYNGYSSVAGSALQAFEINGHLQEGDNTENPYVETVNTGFNYMFTKLTSAAISPQAHGNPDSNGNGIGIQVTDSYPPYQGGMVMDAIAASNNPLGFATTGGDNVKDRFFYDIMVDMVDMYAWGQVDSGNARGGWQYSWNSGADNSACQWAAIGMLAAEDTFGIPVPQFVKDENNSYWLNYSYDGIGFGYTSPGNGTATTPGGMVQLAFDDQDTSDPRWRTAEDYFADNWWWPGNYNFYAMYAWVKAMRLAQPYPVILLEATDLDWYGDPDVGIQNRILDQLRPEGYWSVDYGSGLNTAWAVVMLTPSLFVRPPVADAGKDIIWAYDLELPFDASGSYHGDPARSIVKYEWDFDGDGAYDLTTTDPSDPDAKYTYPDANPDVSGDPPTDFTIRLRVTDDNDPAQIDIDTRKVTAAEPPHAPFAVHDGPYVATALIPFSLDASGSFDVDPGDGISRYQWDLDNDGVWFDNTEIDATSSISSWTYNDTGVYTIALKVWDNGVLNPVGCSGADCIPIESLPEFTTVTVVPNQPPTADAGESYTVASGGYLMLDGSGSSDPNDNPLTYSWDMDNDGSYDDATGVQPAWSWTQSGTYTVGLKVSDGLDDSIATAQVEVTAPTGTLTVDAGENQSVDLGETVNFNGSLIDPGDTVTYSYVWDLGDGSTTTGTLTPSHVYNQTGSFTVTLSISGDDGSLGSDTLTITVGGQAVNMQITSGNTVDDYVMVTFPIDCPDTDAEAVLGLEVNENNLRLGTYDPNAPPPDGPGGYVEYGNGMTIEKGRAYFILSRDALNLLAICNPVSLTEDIEVPLWFNPDNQNGWNQIGPPNDANYTWNDVKVVVKNATGQVIFPDPQNPVDNSIGSPNTDVYIDKRLWEYKPDGTYDDSTTVMQSMRGYFIRVKQANVYLVFSPGAQLAANSTTGNTLLARYLKNAIEFVDQYLLSTDVAFAVSHDYPPSPIGGFSDRVSSSGGGGCFIESVHPNSLTKCKGPGLLILMLVLSVIGITGFIVKKRE